MENVVQNWIGSDRELYRLLEGIENSDLSKIEQAELAMDKLCSMFDLPKMPDDTLRYEEYYKENDVEEKRSVFEENALLKYIYPNEDPRQILVTAVYSVKNFVGVDLDEILLAEFGDDFSDDYVVGYRGNGVHGEIVFPQKEGKSWVDLGCFMAIKIVRLKN
jgi:hypothetical protein